MIMISACGHWGFDFLGKPEKCKEYLPVLCTRLLRGCSVPPPNLLPHSLRMEPRDTNSGLHRTWARQTSGLATRPGAKNGKTLDESLTLSLAMTG